jgi:hypothetical protein
LFSWTFAPRTMLCPMASTDPPLSSDWAGGRYRLGNRWYVFCRSS